MNVPVPLPQAEARFAAHMVNQLQTRVYLVTLGGGVKVQESLQATLDQSGMIVEHTYSGIRNGVTELVSVLIPLS